MQEFQIQIRRTIEDYTTVTVEANTVEEAEEMALNSDLEFDEMSEDNISYTPTRIL